MCHYFTMGKEKLDEHILHDFCVLNIVHKNPHVWVIQI